METIILDILDRLRRGEAVDDRTLVKLIHAEAKRAGGDKRAFAKRRLLPFYQRVKAEEPEHWARWHITPELERKLVGVLRMKPRRSASGVATITVITKPWPCSGRCVFCPSDIRMPKSYLADEPACARAEQSCFDPYLQVSARLTALSQMGHATDKIELIILGGTWSDYPRTYQTWFVTELFRALNDDAVARVGANPMLRGFADGTEGALAEADDTDQAGLVPEGVLMRRARYRACGLMDADAEKTRMPRAASAGELQQRINAGELTYNETVARITGSGTPWGEAARWQTATLGELEVEQRRNEHARHRVVGLVVETRPDAITPERLELIRRMGATKIQMGIQSLDQHILDVNHRGITVEEIRHAFALTRLFGFKIHAHFMVNLLGATPEGDKRDYERFATEEPFQPDEVKLYPCALIDGAELCRCYEAGTWRPYAEEELIDVLTEDVLVTPAWTRVSRMIRDFSSNDIKAGNKKPNLRQLVEQRVAAAGREVHEIRYREVGTREIDLSELLLKVVPYETGATSERFLQWVTPDGHIAGFLRLSLPSEQAVRALSDELGDTAPVRLGEAMIREVHVYGMATRVGAAGSSAQHHGLGRQLIERACGLAREAGYSRINVISAVGTREYYRRLGFADNGLYQQRRLL